MYLGEAYRATPTGFGDAYRATPTGFGASAGGVIGGAAKGAATGAAAGPWGAAVGAVVGGALSLLQPKKHYSPYGFLYDDYPTNIYNNEVKIANLRNAMAQLQGGSITPSPPGPPPRVGGAAYQASMQGIVPRYVPGSESKIAAYDRTLNESGGAFEVTVGRQLQLIQELTQQLSAVQTAAAIRGNVPSPGSATVPGFPVALPANTYPGSTVAPYNPTLPSSYRPSPTSDYSSPTGLPAAQPLFQSGLSALPLLIIAGGAGLLLMFGGKKGR